MDRYLAVVHPVAFIRYKQIQYRGSCLAVLWLFAIGCGLINIFLPMNFTAVSIFAFAVFLPILSTEIFCSLSIVRILRRSGPGHKESQEKKEANQQKRRAVQVICVGLLMLALNNFPFILVPFFNVDTEEFLTAALGLSCLGSPIQAVLFLSRSGRLSCRSIC
ncbi:uncharacterized protein LOC115417878 isoform X2 [Sphaeramia orbicularis]|nr:uncharacterized protein LOC115417878 isoform X2 [Sphaeramia orbicularis]XP_029988515.1 uncharacterized protein LOC115417878 isoform X2 [Sphaeramia orbicularis]